MTLLIFSPLPQYKVLIHIEVESKISSEITDALDLLESIIEQDYLSLNDSWNFVNKESNQPLSSDPYKDVFLPPPEKT